MIPQLQTRASITNGNCLDASLASLLEVPLDQIPDLAAETDNAKWWEGVQNFLRNHGFQLLMMTLTESTPWHSMPHSPWCILVGPTKRGHLHAVVGRTDFEVADAPGKSAFVMIHDPLDGAGGEITVSHVCFLVPISPWRAKREPMIKEIEIQARAPIFGKYALQGYLVRQFNYFQDDPAIREKEQVVSTVDEIFQVPWISEMPCLVFDETAGEVRSGSLVVATVIDLAKRAQSEASPHPMLAHLKNDEATTSDESPYQYKTTPPPEKEVIIVNKGEGINDRAQVTIRDGVAYLWEYRDTDKVFCNSSEIISWRGCHGLDF